MVKKERLKHINPFKENINANYVLYMMQSSQRVEYNYALEYALEIANLLKKPLIVGFTIIPTYPNANTRHYKFMFEGIAELKKEFDKRGILFIIKYGKYQDVLLSLASDACVVVTDSGYLKYQRIIRKEVYDKLRVKTIEVEAGDVIVPIECVSTKLEPYASTIRNKILSKIDYYISNDFKLPPLINKDYSKINHKSDFNTVEEMMKSLKVPYLSDVSFFFKGGYSNACLKLNDFINHKIVNYTNRNDPSLDVTSNLSPYIHFGQISPIEIIKKVMEKPLKPNILNSFINEIVVWRELARNFVFYDENYDNSKSIPMWALKEFQKHQKDRKIIYSIDEFENAKTHDIYWNAAQKELIITGKIHNYMRMYWGKKIIEWSKDIEEAYNTLVYLNDKYAIDGRDPNGYLNIAWLFGRFDRPFFEMPVFGKVRYMSDKGLERKFDIAKYVKKIEKLI